MEWQIFNSKNFGVPQNRERVFIIGHLRGEGTRPIFPFESSITENYSIHTRKIGNVNPSGNGMSGEVYDSEGLSPTLTTNKGEGGKIAVNVVGRLPGKFEIPNRVYDPDGLAPTIRTMQGGGLEPKIIQRGRGYNQGGEYEISPTITSNSFQENNLLKIKEATKKGYSEAEVGDSVNLSHPNSETRRGRVGKGVANTLLTGEEQGVVVYDLHNRSKKDIVGTLTASGHNGNTAKGTFGVYNGFRIRKLTPRECWRLQGFPDWAFDKASQVNSNSQLYKQAGNSVTVNVIAAIARRLL
ncbi:DNA cytosine methyltransferase [Streptococcus dysgalactiae]|uniref:DNA cytosine methyltransferase n=1 Tax=Streptococcus dysgalactiae TaxID=1334 RepID=UPI003D9FB9F2